MTLTEEDKILIKNLYLLKLTAFIQNKIPNKTYISDLFCIWKITEFMPTFLRGAVFLDTVKY